MSEATEGSLGPAVIAVAWVSATLALAIVIARFYVRLRVVKSLKVDDCIILLTLALSLCNSVFTTISVSWGLGQHIDVLAAQPDRVMYTIKYVYLCEFFAIMSPGFGRISFAFLLLQLMPPTPWRKKFLWGIIIGQFIVDVGTVCISFSQCRPIQAFWDKSVDGECWPPTVQQYTGFFQGSVCSLVDFILAIFPASVFMTLNMSLKQRISLSLFMGFGIFAMIASIIKTVQLRAITATGDLTYAMAELAIWWTLEANLVLIAVSIPTLRPIIAKRGNTMPHNRHSHSGHVYVSSSAPSKKRPARSTSTETLGLSQMMYDTTILSNHTISGTEAHGDGFMIDHSPSDEPAQSLDPNTIHKSTTVSITSGLA